VTSFYPVFARELRTVAQCQARHRRRLVAGLYAVMLMAALLVADRWTGAVNLNRLARGIMFWPMAGVIPMLLFIGGLNRAGQMFSAERREGTLPLLLLTRLRGFDILLGKVLQALALQVAGFLVIVPILVLPALALGLEWGEAWRIGLGGLNTMFFGLCLGLLASVLAHGSRERGWRFLLVLPFLANSMPFSMLLPTQVRMSLRGLDWINPCEALAHVSTAMAGLRPLAFWGPLVGSHAAAWACLVLGGWLLSRMTRWRGSMDALPLPTKAAPRRRFGWLSHSAAVRERLLGRNPYLWLASRDRWMTLKTWLLLGVPSLFWGWITWVVVARNGINLSYMMVEANCVSWFFTLLVVIPVEAGRQLADDRLSCALEMVACTPLGRRGIVRGQWMALRRRYMAPALVAVLSSSVLMIVGYVTFGFGGMLDVDERRLWLFWWSSGIVLLPLIGTALGWISMHRAVFAGNPEQAGIIAFLQCVFGPSILLAILFSTAWGGLGSGSLFFLIYAATLGISALQARAKLLGLSHTSLTTRQRSVRHFARLLRRVFPGRSVACPK
jgi:hypothetical protein